MSTIPLDFFLHDEELLKWHEKAIPSDEMYRYFPPKEEIILQDSNPKKNYRFIFNGQQKTEYEQKKLNEYNDYELKHGKLIYPDVWLESDTMRLLQAAEYDMEKTYKTVKDTIKFINSNPTAINNRIVSLLNSGIMYVYGRDHHFRPIIIVSVKTYVNSIEKDKYSFEDINTSIIYLINYIIKYILIPGQIENWITMIDFKGTGVSDVSDFKKLLTTLNSYRGRVFRSFFINVGGFLKMAVKTAINLFGSSSAKKLKILGSDELQKMQEIINPNNIQRKYGGTAPDVVPGYNTNNLFPPRMPSMNYELNGERLNIISEEAYKEMCLNSNPFKPYVISPKYLDKWNKEKEEIQRQKELEEEELNRNANAQKIVEEQVDNKSIRDKMIIEEERMKMIKINELNMRKNKRQYIIDFMKEFEELSIIEIFEEKKYYSKPNVNIEKMNSFFRKIPKCRKVHLY